MSTELNIDTNFNVNARPNRRRAIKRNLLRDEIREAIQEAIESKQIAPGERISETQWAKDMGVSKAPVREAVRELEAMGLLENRPFQGSYVRTVTPKDIDDSFKVRRSLEGLGVRETARLIKEEELEEIYSLVNEIKVFADNYELELYIKKDNAFHEKIMQIADNELLMRLWEQSYLSDLEKAVRKMSKETLCKLAAHHESIFKALEKHNEDQAELAVTLYLDELLEEVIKS